MRKIADADELERELRRLLAYSQSEQPSRSRIASELLVLSHRLAATDPSLKELEDKTRKAIAWLKQHSPKRHPAMISDGRDFLEGLLKDIEKNKPGVAEYGKEIIDDAIEAYNMKL